MNKEVLNDERIKGLKPSSFKAYFYLVQKAGKEKVIEKFSIRGQANEWMNDQTLNLVTSKDTVKTILNELEEANLIIVNLKNRQLKIR